MSVRRERSRLARAFQAALLAVGSPAIVIACGSSGPPPAATRDDSGSPSAPDATLDSFVPRAADAGDASETDASAPPAPHDSSVADVAKSNPPAEGGPGTGGCFAGSYDLDAGPDASPDAMTCAYVYACGLSGAHLGASGCQVLQVGPDGGLLPFAQMTCWLAEDAGCYDDALAPDNEAGGVTVYCAPCPGGRRPAGLRARGTPSAETALGAYLARMAFEEDASIAAFERMGAELRSLGAPTNLRKAAARAARDEVRHARTMSKLAMARGAEVPRARVRRIPPRCAAAVAAENAAEGCVRETYGALVARWQSLHAEDLELRRAFARIAADEASHAALSWAVARWIEPQLGAAARGRVARSRSRALRALQASLAIEPPAELIRSAGLPSVAKARALLRAMTGELCLTGAETSVRLRLQPRVDIGEVLPAEGRAAGGRSAEPVRHRSS